MEPLPILIYSLLLGTVRGQGVYAPANARIVHAGQACVVKEDNVSERVYTIREGSRLQLVCLVKGHPRPQVKWSKTAGSASDRFQETTVFNETLQIERILRVQGGRYYCKAENGIGRSAIKSIRVDVQYLDEPLLTVHQSVSDVRGENYYRERTVFLRCTVNSNPPAHFTWKRGEQLVIQKQDEGVDIYEPLYTQGETKVLKLKDLRPQDYANFSCLVSVRNVCDIPDRSTSFMLKNTTAPPVLSLSVPEVLVVDPGDHVMIECSLEAGDPSPSLSWSHARGPMPRNTRIEGGKLWITDIGPEQAGYYNCSAGNNVGNQAKKWVEIRIRALSNGRFWITPDTFHDDEHIKLEREVKISCQVDAVPQDELSYTWYKNGRPVKTNHRIIISKNDPEFLPGVSSLDIIGMRFSDSATYTCVASLQSGAVPAISIDVNISTNIIPPTIEVSRGLVQVEEGSLAELRCVTGGKPKPCVVWSHTEKDVLLPTGEWETESCDGTLRIENVTREMSGSYRCHTGRYNGLNVKPREGVVQLDVLFPPTVDPQFEEVRQRVGQAVTLGCRLVSGNPMKVTSVQWVFGGRVLESAPSESEDMWEWDIERLTNNQYGTYECFLSNQMGSQSCLFNLTGRAHLPEFYFDTPSPVRFQKSNLYMFILQWTQKQPSSVGDVVKYKLEIQEEGRSGMWRGPEFIVINKTIESGSLLTYTISNLRIPLSYTLHLTPITSFGPGDTAIREIQYITPASDPAPSGELLCGFEDEQICGFTQDTRDDFDWTRESNMTYNPINTPNTGPRFDNSGSESGYYMFIEASTPRQPMDRARLLSPLFNVSKTVKFGAKRNVPFCVNFFYHMYGKHVGSLNILVRAREATAVETQVWTLSGNQAEKWQQANVTINPGGPFQVIIEAVRGSGFLGDIGLDDVSITKGSCMKRPFTEKAVIPRSRNAGRGPGPGTLSTFLLLVVLIRLQLLLR